MDLSGNHKINLTGEKETLLITLLAKAIDSRRRSKHPILHDRKTAEILHMIDYDFEKINHFGNGIMVGHKSKAVGYMATGVYKKAT